MGTVIKTIYLIFIVFVISIPFVNNYSAQQVENELLAIPLPQETTLVESISNAGKVVGNGNGMQYLGVILIESELSLDDLQDYYSGYNDKIQIEKQNSQEIEFIQIGTLEFSSKITSFENCYIVYLWGEGIAPFSELDLRGH